MANTLLTPTKIVRESLFHLTNNLVMGQSVYKDFESEYKKNGETLTIRMPVKFTSSTGATRVNSDVTEQSSVFTVATQKHVSWKFNSKDLTLTIEDYAKRYIKPAMIALANDVDVALATLYKDVYNQQGTPGITPATFAVLGNCGQRLDEEATPADDRRGVLNPAANWSLADALKGTFDAQLAKDIVRKGFLGSIAGLKLNMDQNVQRHTTGYFTTGSTPLVNGASQTGAALITDGWALSTAVLKQGDIFTIVGVNAVNPISGVDLGYLKPFVVTADGTSSGAGALTIAISPAIITSGPYKTCSASPADNAGITPVGTQSTVYPINLVFHPDAFGLVMAPMDIPQGAAFAARATYDGVSVRIIRDYDISADEDIIRCDILFGVKAIRPEFACRLIG